MTFTTESRNQHLVVFLYKVKTTVIGDKSSDFLSVLDKLDSHTLPNGRVRLLSLNTNFLKNDSLEPFSISFLKILSDMSSNINTNFINESCNTNRETSSLTQLVHFLWINTFLKHSNGFRQCGG